MKNKFSVRTVVAIGIGAAVFVILGRFLVIPTGIPNTNMELTHPLWHLWLPYSDLLQADSLHLSDMH
uniref:ECF transporter S component n=1 Tax=Clostridium sp. NkU-1 TaxID=1095009 RepID=UPI003261059C